MAELVGIWFTRSFDPGYTDLDIVFFFFFKDTATTEIYTLSLHDALPIEQHRPGAQRHLPAGIDKKPIDFQPRLFAKPDRRIAAEPHSQSGRDAGHDFVAEKDRRGPNERAANRVELGECLTLDVLDRADPLDGARRYADKDERECQRSVAKKPASIAGPVAFDLAEVGHRGSRQLGVPGGAVPIIVAGASGAFCHLGHIGANKRTRWNRPATRLQRRRQVQ